MKRTTANVPSATRTFDQQPSFESVKNATLDRTEVDASSVVGLEYQMLITVQNVYDLKRIEMDVPK